MRLFPELRLKVSDVWIIAFHVRQSLEDILKICLWIDTMSFAVFDDGIDDGSALQSEWESSLETWQCCEGSLQLSGWTCSRRVVIYRRIHHKKGSKAKAAKALNGPVEENELLQLVEHLRKARR